MCKAQRPASKRAAIARFAGIDGSEYEFLLTFGSADSRIRLRKESEQLVA